MPFARKRESNFSQFWIPVFTGMTFETVHFMIEINRKEKERAMLIAVQTRHISREMVEEHLAELEELSDTAGAETIFKIIRLE